MSACHREAVAIAALDEIEHYRSLAGGGDLGELAEMLGAPAS